MLLNPEFFAMLAAQVTVKEPAKPLVERAKKIHKGGPQKTRQVDYQSLDESESEKDVDYLNEKRSNLNLYA